MIPDIVFEGEDRVLDERVQIVYKLAKGNFFSLLLTKVNDTIRNEEVINKLTFREYGKILCYLASVPVDEIPVSKIRNLRNFLILKIELFLLFKIITNMNCQ